MQSCGCTMDNEGSSEDVRSWPVIQKIEDAMQLESFSSANPIFTELKRTVLAATQEELDEQRCHAEVVWTFLIGFAAEKNMYRSFIIQVARRLMEVPGWQAVFRSLMTLQKKARMLHPDLQLAFGQKPEYKGKPKPPVNGVLDREHCCACNNCAKPWAFSCKYKSPHYCMRHYQQAQQTTSDKLDDKDVLASWSGCAPSGFDGEAVADTHVMLRSTLPVQTQRLVASSTSQAKFKQELSSHKVKIMPDKVNRSIVEKGQNLVVKIREAMQKNEREDVESLSKELSQLIPQDDFQPITSEEDLLKQVEILIVLDSIIDTNELKSHDALSKYCDIGYLDPETEEGKLVRGMLMQNLGGDVDITNMDAFRVSRHEEEEREQTWADITPSNNRVLLWHGSQNTRFVSILRHGLDVKAGGQWMPGGTFDNGIYFSDVVSKSLQYCGGSSDEVLLVLAEVCLGSMYCCKGRYGLCFDWKARSTAKQLGCHSTWGVGRIWPDPSTSVLGSPDTTVPCCDVPLGQPIRVRGGDGSDPVLEYNEFTVYEARQVRLRYLIRLRYDSTKKIPSNPSSPLSQNTLSLRSSQKLHGDIPSIWMKPIEGNVLQIPYCRFARDCAFEKLESSYRWQYYFDKKQMFDSTLPGWHSFGISESKVMERSFSNGETSTKVRSSNGYEYDMDFMRMQQHNLSTKKTRSIRRVQVALRRVSVSGGKSFKVSMDLSAGQTAEWIFEVEGDQRLDFKAEFCPLSVDDGDVVKIVNATLGAHAWSYVTPCAGRVQLQWKNGWSMASSRVLLYDWHKDDPVIKPGKMFGGASSGDPSDSSMLPESAPTAEAAEPTSGYCVSRGEHEAQMLPEREVVSEEEDEEF